MAVFLSVAALSFVALNGVARYKAMSRASQNAVALEIVSDVIPSSPVPQCNVPSSDLETGASASVEETSWTFPLSSMLLLYNAVFWCLLWAICACCRGRCERRERQRSFFREMTGDKILRTTSITHWITPASYANPTAERDYPMPHGEKPTKVSRRVQAGRFDQCLLRLGKAFGTLKGFMLVFTFVFVSVALAFSQIHRRRVVQTHETIYGMAWASLVDAIEATPVKIMQFYVGRLLYDYLVHLVGVVSGAVFVWITSLCYCWRRTSNNDERFKKLEQETAVLKSAITPVDTTVPAVFKDITAMGRIVSDPADCKDGGGHLSPVKRIRSAAALDARTAFRRDVSLGGRPLSRAKTRDARLSDITSVPDLNGIPWVGPSLGRPLSVPPLPSAPPPPYDDTTEA